MNTPRFQKQILEFDTSTKIMVMLAKFLRILLTPVMLVYRIYLWVWDETMGEKLDALARKMEEHYKKL